MKSGSTYLVSTLERKFRVFFTLFVLITPCALAQIQGIVVDSVSGSPLSGALVRIQMREAVATTDSNGFFQLNDLLPFPFKLVATAPGYYNKGRLITTSGGLNNLTFELEQVPTSVEPQHPLNAPATCGQCHPNQFSEWQQSPMAHTGLNQWVFDLYNGTGTAGGMSGFVYQRDSIHRGAKPNSDCSACHSPIHWLSDIQNAGMGDFNNPNEAMERGVQCEVCHRMSNIDPSKLNFPGVDPRAFTMLRGPQDVEFGLLGDADYENFIMKPAYNPQLSARLCAACHEDNVDVDDDDDFEDEGSVEHESTFSEWEQYRQSSGSNSTCVDCHMPVTQETSFCLFVENRRPGTIHNHDIRGTTAAFLENALSLNVGMQTTLAGLQLHVELSNTGAGHSVPTGVVVRNVLLLVEYKDANGNRLPLLSGETLDEVAGIGDPSSGYYAGLPGRAFFRNMANDQEQRLFYTEADRIEADTRLGPGATYRGSFSFQLPAGIPAGAQSLDVRVIYRRAFRAFVDVKSWTLTGHGAPLADVAAPHFGHLMERHQQSLDVCQPRDLDQSGAVDNQDLLLLAPQWLSSAPFQANEAPLTNVRHMIALVNCASGTP